MQTLNHIALIKNTTEHVAEATKQNVNMEWINI